MSRDLNSSNGAGIRRGKVSFGSIVSRRLICFAYFTASVFSMGVPSANAGPANPASFKIQQPDGSVFTANVRGDEFQNWTETAEGYTIIKNDATGTYEYAIPDAKGLPILSGVAVVRDGAAVNVPENLWPKKHLKPARNVELEEFQERSLQNAQVKRFGSGAAFTSPTGIFAPTPVTGPKKILMILVNFTDVALQPGAINYWGDLVHSTTAPSVAKYYQDNSFGNVAITPVTSTQGGSQNGVVSVTLAQNHPNCGKTCSYAVESAWINSALAAAAPFVNFAALDTNSDGTISVDETLVYFVLAGFEAAEVDSADRGLHGLGVVLCADRCLEELEHVPLVDEASHPEQPGLVRRAYFVWRVKVVEAQLLEASALQQSVDLADEESVVGQADPLGVLVGQRDLELLQFDQRNSEDLELVDFEQVVSSHSFAGHGREVVPVLEHQVEVSLVEVLGLWTLVVVSSLCPGLFVEADHGYCRMMPLDLKTWSMQTDLRMLSLSAYTGEGCGCSRASEQISRIR